ncbi:phosphotransferase family protein [Halovivax sp.]|uniref:phosphotransferase family protein n=1 Tax=Halovivax sp. TaxID=1935978 RepID=UPI0025C07123|nr:phosphotransferase [Halovivax sp.]
MNERILAAIEARGRDLEVLRTLHDVPPHEVYEIEFDGRRAVCKVSVAPRGSAGVEGRALRRVGRETSIPVPDVLDVGEDWFVAAYREEAPGDVPDDEKRLREGWLRAAGRTLARLHEEATFDRPGLLAVDGDPTDSASGLRVEAAVDATWPDALDDQLAVYERSVAGTGYANAVAGAREFLRAHADRFDVLEEGSAPLLHGWFTPDHVAVADGEPTCVIDFEHALAGSPEWDYWRTAVPLFVGGNWKQPDDAEAQFRSAYESVRPLPDGFDDRGESYRAFVAASHFDSLATQRGIHEETREIAEFLVEYVDETLDSCRDRWR